MELVRPRSPRELVAFARELRAREAVIDDIERRLLEEMLAHPDDAGARIVYADWLEQSGRAVHAERVRLQLGTSIGDAANPRVLLAQCYGIELPEEIFVVIESGLDLPGSPTTLPWDLTTFKKDPYIVDEEKLYALDRELVPLLEVDNEIACYRLDELAAGRTTIFTLSRTFDDYSEAVRDADSLLAYAHASAEAALAAAEHEYHSPGNRGAGSIDLEEVEWRRTAVRNVEAMQAELAARRARGRA